MKFLRFGVCLLITFAVAAHGVVEVWSESIFEIGAAVLFLTWGITATRSKDSKIYWSDLNWPIAAFFVWAILQLALRITIYPFLTWTALLRWGACYMIFFVASQVFRNRGELRALTWFLVLLGFTVALEGIIQHFTSNGKIYWVRELQLGGELFGPYVNRNHFAGLMELLIPIGLAFLVFRGVRRDLVPLTGLFTLVPVGALVLSASRAGVLAFILEVVLLVAIFGVRKTGKIRLGPAVMFLLVLVGLIGWLGAGQMYERFTTKHASELPFTRRMSMAKGAARVFLAHPLTGTGLGTLVVAFPRYETDYDGKLVDHAHNDYLEAFAELGLPGAIFGLAFLWILASQGFAALEPEQSHFSTAYHAAALVACFGLLIHSFVDFNLHIPSNALIFLLQAGLAVSPPLPPENPTRRNQRTSRSHSKVDMGVPASP
ncbi:MAG: O-antigen ligase family protein [Candidatus Acidiferrales bacterium]